MVPDNSLNKCEFLFDKMLQILFLNFCLLKGKYFIIAAFCFLGCFINQSFSQCPTKIDASRIIADRNLDSLNHLIFTSKECKTISDTILAEAYHALAIAYYSAYLGNNEFSDINKAIDATLEALDIRKRILPENAFLTGKNHHNLGSFYLKIKNYKLSESHLKNALVIFNINNNGEPKREVNSALELVDLYGEKGDYAKCLNYFQIALNIAKKNNDPNLIGRSYTTYSNQLLEMKKFSESLEAANNAISVYQSEVEDRKGLVSNYLNAGTALLELKQYDEALSFFKKSLDLNNTVGDVETEWKLINNIATTFQYKKNYKDALDYFHRSLDIATEYEVNDYMAINFHNIGDVYLDQKNYATAIEYFHKAIIYSVEDFNESDVTASPSTQSISLIKNKADFLKHLSKKAACLKGLSEQKDRERNLKLALENYQLASQLIDLMREEFTGQGSKLHWLEAAYPLLENAIEVSLELHEITGKSIYKESVLDFMEKNKAVLLLESINSAKDIYFADIPDSLIAQQNQLKNEIAGKQRKLLDLQKKKTNQDNDSILSISENDLARLKIKLSDLEELLKSKYPGFNQLSKIQTINLNELKNHLLTNNQALVEYFVGDSTTYIVGISKNHFSIKAIFTEELLQHTSDLLYVIHPSRRQKATTQDYFQRFTQSSYSLYNLLLKEVLSEFTEIDQIIIVPDDVISYLPFDILLQEAVSSDIVDFSPDKLNYLIKDYSITYAYSGTVLADMISSKKTQIRRGSFLGVAPGFGEGEGKLTSGGRACNFETPEPLNYNQPEVEDINAFMGGKTMIGSAANKASFLEMASKYSILHLATHACADADNSARNRIFFSDGYLYNHELSNLDITADMVVLSACETGIGEFKRGEGIMSLARGFAYSGTPSITMSLWSVNDQSTSELMSLYYQYLNKGLAKDVALRKAKLDYLSNLEDYYKLHPLFWAAFVHYGNTEPIIKKSYRKWYLGGVIFLLLMLGVVRYFR